MKFLPFEERLGLGHYGIHRAENFESIMEEIVEKAVMSSIEKGRHNFNLVTDVNGLNSHIFSFFDVMHMAYSEKIENDKEDATEVSNEKNQVNTDQLSFFNINSLKTGLDKTVRTTASNLSDSVTTAASNLSDSVAGLSAPLPKSASSVLKLNPFSKLF